MKQEGKINPKIQQYAQDFGFKIRVCMSRRPQTKGKVEAQMKVLDFIHAYQQEITFEECIEKIQEKNNEENSKFHYSYQRIPYLALEKEKAHLLPLPQDKLRRAYTIQTISVKVNRSSMVHYCGNAYSVSKQYTGKIIQLQIYDSKI